MAQYFFAILLILLALIFLPFLTTDLGTKELNETTRADLDEAHFVALPDGVTRYEWAGPESGEKVIFVHGYSSPCTIWENNFYALAEAGYRVLRYDLFGRGYSDRPETDYSPEFFDKQLLDLMEAFDIHEPVHLVGLSMGGAIVLGFVDRHPQQVDKVALFAPAGLNTLPAISQLLQVPALGEWVMATLGDFITIHIVPRQIEDDPFRRDQIQEMYRDQCQYCGYNEALLSTLRCGPLTGQEMVYQRVGQQNRSGMVFWGTEDTVVPYELLEKAQAFLPRFEFISVQGAGHSAPFDCPEELNPKLIAYLKS